MDKKIENGDIATLMECLKKEFPKHSIELQSKIPFSSSPDSYCFIIDAKQTLIGIDNTARKYNAQSLEENFECIKKEINIFLGGGEMTLDATKKENEKKEEKTVKIEKDANVEIKGESPEKKTSKKESTGKAEGMKTSDEVIGVANAMNALAVKYELGCRIVAGDKISSTNAFIIDEKGYEDRIYLSASIIPKKQTILNFDKKMFLAAVQNVTEMEINEAGQAVVKKGQEDKTESTKKKK